MKTFNTLMIILGIMQSGLALANELPSESIHKSVVSVHYNSQANFVFKGSQFELDVPLTSTGAIDWSAAVGVDETHLNAFLNSNNISIEVDGRIYVIPGSHILDALLAVGYSDKVGGTAGFDPNGGPYVGVGLETVLNDIVVIGAKVTQGLKGPPRILFSFGFRLPQ